MLQISLDARSWRTEEDFFDGLLAGLEAPKWHGHNVNALIDSIVVGGINGVLPPFKITISSIYDAGEDVRDLLIYVFQILEKRGAELIGPTDLGQIELSVRQQLLDRT